MKMLYFVNDVSSGQSLFCGSAHEEAEEFIHDEVRASDYLYASSDFIIEECQEETFLKGQTGIVNLYLGLLWQAQHKLNIAQAVIDKRNAPPTVN